MFNIGDKVRIKCIVEDDLETRIQYKDDIGTESTIRRIDKWDYEYPYILEGVLGYFKEEELELVDSISY